ncbi:MAG TPA: ABC transporter permease, partial [Microthrixaceae bacterium]|nr:ABC transporter permease [Microthrixaceae bacterium]
SVVIAVVAAAVVPAWRAAASAARVGGPTRPGVALAVSRLAPGGAVSTGVRFALDPGHGATSVPTRSTLVGAATGVAIAVVVTVVAASLNHLVETPRLYGSDWNATLTVELDEGFGNDSDELTPTLTAALDDDPAVAAWSPISAAQVTIDGAPTQAVAFLSTAKPIEPTIAAGRAPDGADEIALGQLTMNRLGVDIGDTVEVEGDDESVATATVVGRVILPAIAQYSGSDKTSLGDGALLGDEEADYLLAVVESPLAVQMAPGESVDDLADRLEAMGVGAEAAEVARPTDIDSMADLRNTPSALASLLLVLIAFAVCHALFVAARSRRRELGIMQALGATRGNVRLVLVVQALTVAGIACVTGLITGLFIARWSWQALMDSFGALAEPTAPPLLLAGLLAAVVLLALLASLWPAHRALRESPAEALATE